MKNKINDIINKFIIRIKKIKKRSIYCVIVGLVFAVFSFFTNDKSIYVRKNEIARSDYGTQKVPYKINIDAENLAKDLDFDISVSSRKYTKDEADKIFSKKLEELKTNILNENIDFEHICGKLNFTTDLGDGIKASYRFEPKYEDENSDRELEVEKSTKSEADAFSYYVKYQNLIDGNGNVKNQDFKSDEFCTGYIEVQLSTEIKDKEGSYKSDKYLLPVIVISKKMSVMESFKNSFVKAVEYSDKDTIDRETIILPSIVDNFKINYKSKRDLTFILMPFIGLFVAILLEAKDREKIKEEEKRKKRGLENDFSQIISKILLYVSSGMTIRNAFIRLAEQYQIKLQNKKVEKRVAYDEIITVKNKLLSGYSEIKAYEEMAKNINLRTYTRFLNIIIQSIKNGNKELKNILNMEVQDALYERKQRAKKMGEEATTKLVLPLMMMLAVIMVVIMVPAFMGM